MEDVLSHVGVYVIVAIIISSWYSLFLKIIKPNKKNIKEGALELGLVLICTYLSFEITIEILTVIPQIIKIMR